MSYHHQSYYTNLRRHSDDPMYHSYAQHPPAGPGQPKHAPPIGGYHPQQSSVVLPSMYGQGQPQPYYRYPDRPTTPNPTMRRPSLLSPGTYPGAPNQTHSQAHTTGSAPGQPGQPGAPAPPGAGSYFYKPHPVSSFNNYSMSGPDKGAPAPRKNSITTTAPFAAADVPSPTHLYYRRRSSDATSSSFATSSASRRESSDSNNTNNTSTISNSVNAMSIEGDEPSSEPEGQGQGHEGAPPAGAPPGAPPAGVGPHIPPPSFLSSSFTHPSHLSVNYPGYTGISPPGPGALSTHLSLGPFANSSPYARSPELRISHKLAERKRRREMSNLFDELRDVLPIDRALKSSKWEILTKAIEFVSTLKQHNTEMARENLYLREQLGAYVQHQPPPQYPHYYAQYPSEHPLPVPGGAGYAPPPGHEPGAVPPAEAPVANAAQPVPPALEDTPSATSSPVTLSSSHSTVKNESMDRPFKRPKTAEVAAVPTPVS